MDPVYLCLPSFLSIVFSVTEIVPLRVDSCYMKYKKFTFYIFYDGVVVDLSFLLFLGWITPFSVIIYTSR